MSILRRGFLTIVVSLLAVTASPPGGRADGPDVGGYLGAAFPLNDYDRFVDTGAVIGGWGGYRWRVADVFAISVVGNPQFTIMPNEGCPGRLRGICNNDDDVASTFSISAGPKFTMIGGRGEFSVAVLGGYYNDIAGTLDEDGGGLAVHATLAGNVGSGVRLGVFGRFEQQWLGADLSRPCPQCGLEVDGDRQLMMVGVSVGWTPEEYVEPAPVAYRPAPAAAAPAPTKRRFVLRGVNFDFDKANIRPDAAPVLDEAIRALNAEPDMTVSVEGHTDAIGSDAYNSRLSERRAAAVRDYLIRGGIAPSRLQGVGFGESRPVATNETEEGRAQNRRAELNVR